MGDDLYSRVRRFAFPVSVLAVLVLTGLLVYRASHGDGSGIPKWSDVLLIIGVGVSFLVACYFSPINAREKSEEKKVNEIGSLCDVNGLLHHSGLRVPAGTKFHLYLTRRGLLVESKTERFTISDAQITDIKVLDLSEVRKHYVDNTSGAVAGGLMFGAIGALLMGGTKEITEINERYYLVVSYVSSDSGADKYLSFQVPPKLLLDARSLESRWYRSSNKKYDKTAGKREIKL